MTLRAMAGLAAAAHETCGLESMKLPFDMTVEAGALGAKIDYGTKKTLPQVKEHLYRDPGELVIGEDLMEQGRIPVVLEAIRIGQENVWEEDSRCLLDCRSFYPLCHALRF